MKRVFVILIALTFINVNVAAAKKRKPDCTWQIPKDPSYIMHQLMVKGKVRLARVKGVITLPGRRGDYRKRVNWTASVSKAYYWSPKKPRFVMVVHKFRHYKTGEWIYQFGGHIVRGLRKKACTR